MLSNHSTCIDSFFCHVPSRNRQIPRCVELTRTSVLPNMFYQTCSTKHVLPNMFYQTVEFPKYIMYVLLSTLMCVYLVHLLLVPSSRGLEELLCDSNSLEELLWRRSASGERLRRHNLRSHIVAVCILV